MPKRSNKGLKLADTVLGIMPTSQGCLVVTQAFHASADDPIVVRIQKLTDIPMRFHAKALRWMRSLDVTPA